MSYAGVADSFAFSAPPVIVSASDQVSYGSSTLELDTYVGYAVGSGGYVVTRQNNNNVTKFVLTFTATINDKDDIKVTDPKAVLTVLGPQSTFASSCSSVGGTLSVSSGGNPATLTCSVRQAKSNFQFPSFDVFFGAPKDIVPTEACTLSAADCNRVATSVTLTYSEGTTDTPTNFINSQQSVSGSKVYLGTSNPTFVQTALPKGLSTKLFTGAAPLPGQDTQFTENTDIPALPPGIAYARAAISIKPSVNDTQCINLGNFTTCPLYETTIVDPTNTKIEFPKPASFISFLYRIDASNLKRPASQILNNTQIFYTDDVVNGLPVFNNPLTTLCTFDTSGGLTSGTPCIDTRSGSAPQCYKNLPKVNGLANPLEGDCAWRILNFSNGFVKFN
jgi:hypothetical protein